MARELKPEELRRTFDPDSLGIASTERVESLNGIIGQERAVSALRFGLGIDAAGFNIFVAGPPGIGKMTAVQAFLEESARRKETPPDWCYLNDFDDPSQPRVCRLPPGRGRALQQEMRNLIDHVRREIPRVFESDEYAGKREAILKDLEGKKAGLLDHLRQLAEQSGFALQATPLGVAIIPVVEGRTLNESDFGALEAAAQQEIKRRREAVAADLKNAMKPIRDLERTAQERLQALDQEVALYVVEEPLQELAQRYQDAPDFADYPERVQRDILEHLDAFKGTGSGEGAGSEGASDNDGAPGPAWAKELPFRKYRVNLLVDNSRLEGAPVVVELNPSYHHLFGRVEREAQFGFSYTDFTMVKAGALHRANGGYLVLPIEDVLRSPLAWDGLKRALRAGEIEVENLSERIELAPTRTVRPQPIPVRVKVILVGRPVLYYLLDAHDEDFRQLFKVKADFDTEMALNDGNVRDLLSFAGTLCEKEKLRHLDAGALARLLEHAMRLAEDQERLSTHFGAIADVIREASFWAAQSDAPLVTAGEMERALNEKVYRSSQVEERLREMLARRMLLIDTAGEAIGQVNGLSVVSLGDHAFGRPARITASVGPGMEGILDIEREVALAGPIHSKGVLILGGYLLHRYGHNFPLAMTARLSFEQSYSEVEGDSASAAELFALLSALAELPIRQGLAVTGSVNQRGEVQAIGGVNEKIEGFFDVCRLTGFTGDQGVVVPASNVHNLMLRKDVVEGVGAGSFHLWPIRTVDEGIELLTGVLAGERDGGGTFPDDSVNALVDQRLLEFTEILSKLGEGGGRRRRLIAPPNG